MCGLFGILGGKSGINVNDVINSLKHRGPDDQSLVNVNEGILIHTRLSIIDLSNQAKQPMVDDSRRYTIVYNGEVYNHDVLRKELVGLNINFKSKSDTEVILKGYAVWGEKLFPKLRGMFAFAIYDAKKREVVLVRDGMGIKPLLYSKIGGKIIFGSEIKAIMSTGLIEKKLNTRAVTSLLKYGSIHNLKLLDNKRLNQCFH